MPNVVIWLVCIAVYGGAAEITGCVGKVYRFLLHLVTLVQCRAELSYSVITDFLSVYSMAVASVFNFHMMLLEWGGDSPSSSVLSFLIALPKSKETKYTRRNKRRATRSVWKIF